MEEVTPLGMDELVAKAIRLYCGRFTFLIGITAAAQMPVMLLRVLVALISADSQLHNLAVWLNFIGLWVSVISSTLLVGALISAISNLHLNQPASLISSYGRSATRFWSIFGTSIVIGLIEVPGFVIRIYTRLNLISASSYSNGIFSVLLTILAIALLGPRWAVAFEAVVLEKKGPGQALVQSWNLTRGYFWKMAGVTITPWVVVYIIYLLPWTIMYVGANDLSLAKNIQLAIRIALEMSTTIFTLPMGMVINVLAYYALSDLKQEKLHEPTAIHPAA